jgi:hypothetical protein
MYYSKMVKSTFEIPEKENRMLNVIKGQLGLKNKQQALLFVLSSYEEQMEPEVRPEYLNKLSKIKKQRGKTFKSKKDFLNYLESGL